MLQVDTRYLKQDCGCYVDGAFGVGHAVDLVGGMVYEYNASLAAELWQANHKIDGLDIDAAYELLDEATKILQAHTVNGLSWVWVEGDLLLTVAS